jgi:hypothetical protein
MRTLHHRMDRDRTELRSRVTPQQYRIVNEPMLSCTASLSL